MNLYRWLPTCLLLLLLLCAPLFGQSSTPSIQNPTLGVHPTSSAQQDPQFDPRRNDQPRLDETTEKQMARERQRERWRDIKKRSEKLLEVATELKQYVDKSGENVLSVEVLKKAEEMEKLSRDLQKRMKGD